MTFTEAAAEVLRLAGKPLHYKEITEIAIEQNLLSHVGKSPEVTMGARLAALLKKDDKATTIVRVKPGIFALRDLDDKKSKPKIEKTPEPEPEHAGTEVNALEVEAASREPAPQPPLAPERATTPFLEEEPPVVSGEDALRADLAARGAELFDDEDDDDQPILAPPASPNPQDALPSEGRRRRRRRRRGRGPSNGEAAELRPDVPPPPSPPDTEIPAETGREPPAPPARPTVRDRQQIMAGGSPTGIDVPAGEGEELGGRDLADAAAMVLGSFDRNGGPVQLRAVVEGLMRRGRLSGDQASASVQLAASLRADNLRRASLAQRSRFRFANGSRVSLTDWGLGGDLLRLEQEALAALDRYRDAARRVLLRRIMELPGHAFVELTLVALERLGMTQIRSVRRAGSPGGEAHFSALHKTGGDEIRTAIVIRKDGRDIGRERVTDLRGAFHYYGPATAGWLISTGQALSGAREEATAPGAAPVAVYDGLGVARLFEEIDLAVVRTRHPIAIPDLELLETLRG